MSRPDAAMIRRLTPMQSRFVDEYFVDLDGSRAVARAGYAGKSAKQRAHHLMIKPHVRAAVQQRVAAALAAQAARLELGQGHLLAELARMAFTNLDDVAQWGVGEDGKPFLEALPAEKLGPDHRAALHEISLTSTGLRVKIHDKMAALLALARLMGLPRAQAAAGEAQQAGFAAVVAELSDVPEAVRDQISALLAGAG